MEELCVRHSYPMSFQCDVDDALLNMKKSVDDEEIAKFESFNENYGQD